MKKICKDKMLEGYNEKMLYVENVVRIIFWKVIIKRIFNRHDKENNVRRIKFWKVMTKQKCWVDMINKTML